MYELLATINDPADLRRLDRRQLQQVAVELRQFLIDSVSQTGAIGQDPARHAATVLTRLLRDRGVVVEGEPGTGAVADGSVQLATVTSQGLPALLNEMLAPATTSPPRCW